MKNKYLYIETFGCQMNVHDSEQMAALLAGSGYQPTEYPEKADLILFNTCSIREKAEQKAFSELGRILRLKRRHPKLIVGFGGCLAQHLGARVFHRAAEVDFVFGTHNIHLLPEMVAAVEKKRQRITQVDFYKQLPSANIFAPPAKGAVSTFVTIMQGCNNFCTYCVVPYLRGPEMSRTPQEIIEEIKRLVDYGVREVTLLGQNVNSYGKTLDGQINFADLIRKVGRVDGIERIRFTTSHPKDLSEELINCFAQEKKLCEHIHLPVQSGSNKILKLMNRGYTAEDYLGKVAHLRQVCPQISITSDIIVGFPQESEKDYQETIDMMGKIRFDSVFSFKYSERIGTAAKKLEGKVEETEKLRRLKALQLLQDTYTLEKNKQFEGSTQEILVEATSKNSKSDMMGRTRSWKIVNFRGNRTLAGNLVEAKITRAYLHSLRGEIN
jgi:tRNA-2-methylthio-N6-dimethylallyladenosine synthase